MTDKRELIRFQNVGKCYSTAARGEVWAVRDFNAVCHEGQLTCLLGPSGCGKTTLLRLAAGLESPTTGRVFVDLAHVNGPPKDIGLLSQEGDLLPWRKVLDNVALGPEIHGVRRNKRFTAAKEALARVGLPAKVTGSFPHELSGGMRQRVALARALCAGSRILLMDEPFTSLDEPTRHRLQAELLDVWLADQQTVLFVTHSLEEAVYLADRIIVMTSDRTIADFQLDLPRPRHRLSDDFVEVLLEVRRAFAESDNSFLD